MFSQETMNAGLSKCVVEEYKSEKRKSLTKFVDREKADSLCVCSLGEKHRTRAAAEVNYGERHILPGNQIVCLPER